MDHELTFTDKMYVFTALFLIFSILTTTIIAVIIGFKKREEVSCNTINNEIADNNPNVSFNDSKENSISEIISNRVDEEVQVDVDIPEEVEEPAVSTTTYTYYEIDLISIVTMAEAEGESELGQRLVIDVVLNRVDSSSFPNSVYDVIYQKNQFTSMTNGRADKCYVKDEIRALVLEEIESRTNYEVLYFRTGHYHSFGTPVLQEGHHYFSK